MKKTILLVITLSVLMGPLTLSPARAQDYGPCPTSETRPEKQGDNLLVNPSFEWPYYYLWQEAGVGNGCVPSGWVHWYSLPEGDGRGDYFIPEWKPVQIGLEPQGVFDGVSSVAYYKPWAYHLAGMYQQVEVPANATLTFTAYGMAWSTDQEDPVKYDSSGSPNPIPMSIGVDPTGGTNPFSEAIVWSDIKAPLDVFEQFSVQATAQGSTVTVFLWSHNGLYDSNLPVQWIDVFWDATNLRVSGSTVAPTAVPPQNDNDGEPDDDEAQPTAVPPSSGTDSTEGVTPAEAQPARDDGSQWHVVREGESLIRIAAAYDVETQTIRELNGLTGDSIFPEQELLIKPAPIEAEPTAEEPAAEPEEQPAEEAATELGQICMVVFDDQDTNGEWGQGEPTVAGATVSLTGQQNETYTTEATGEPFCVSEVKAGNYTVEVMPPNGYGVAEGSSPVAVTVSPGGDVALDVPLLVETTPTAAPAPIQTAETPAERPGPSPLIVGLVIAGAGMVITSVVTTIIITRQAR